MVAAPAAAAGQRRVARKADLPEVAEVWEAGAPRAEAELGDDGRVVVRASGTEPLVRVMVEAPTAEDVRAMVSEIAESRGSSGAVTLIRGPER